eukprot:scaffold42005_cov72-Phaeocystis_antarctica.AAC.2
MACFILLTVSASAALLGSAPVNTCREHPRASVIMQANRRSVLAAAACLVLPTKAWAGYALGAAAVAEHSTVATGKAKEQAVYDSVRSSIDAKRPDRPDLGTRARAPGLRWWRVHQGVIARPHRVRAAAGPSGVEEDGRSLHPARGSAGWGRTHDGLAARRSVQVRP